MTPVRTLLAAFGLATALISGTAAQAHPKLVSSTPAADATVERPARIELRFNETLVNQFSGIDLVMTDMPGMKMPPMKIAVDTSVGADGKTLVAVPKSALHTGTYKLDWHAVTADTHRVNGTFNFKVK
ncbi:MULTISPECIES: copper homeostasis periplasmic binding protein CopC [Novosphingobium]|uniref:Copper homeostasis periplasmic binding protein CopC n=1 Tax=Novosphingobium mangrovi (ex Huang et al. 2023) TaxID=2976432 RepID=A0ABT2I7V9_9SPHN|nr:MULTISPECIES: copper homeostasis periplasmic binding protein CopC [Novosphingobium]MCT2400904.1 copper homeostasis periplasmic binding protein CopC [Novosphingobium mangrovi (ex Huang et al. 2023)]CCA93214.1 copper resistance protein CopC [Novosphingobium sp. PP1Y]